VRRFSGNAAEATPSAARGGALGAIPEGAGGSFPPLRRMADAVIDTSESQRPPASGKSLFGDFAARGPAGLKVSVISFGYRYGNPRRGRHGGPTSGSSTIRTSFRPSSASTALDPGSPATMSWGPAAFEGVSLRRLSDLLLFLLPLYRKEGKAYFTLGVGCTGGRHRSVAIAEALGDILGKGKEAARPSVHRDLSRFLPGPPRG